jgi:hypothetical protein
MILFVFKDKTYGDFVKDGLWITLRRRRRHQMWAYCDESGHFADKDFICMVGIVFETDRIGKAFEKS